MEKYEDLPELARIPYRGQKYMWLNFLGLKRLTTIREIIPAREWIAYYDALGDYEAAGTVAQYFDSILPPCNIFLTVESKGIGFAQELGRLRGHKVFVVCSTKERVPNSYKTTYHPITSRVPKELYLDPAKAELLLDKDVIIFDDFVSKGESMNAMERLALQAGVQRKRIVQKTAVFKEADFYNGTDVRFIRQIPILVASE